MVFARVVVVAGLLLGLATTVQAEPVKAGSELWLLAKYDSNGDNVISMDEISGRREKVFGHMDANADGIVSFDEYHSLDIQRRELILKARFDKLDLDRDGIINAAEYSSYLGSFDRFDSDGDGRITAADITASNTAAAPTKVAADNTRCVLWVCVRTSLD